MAAIVIALRDLERDKMLTYEQIKEALGLDLQGRNRDYSMFHQARGIARREHDVVLHCIPGVGYKRLNDEDTALDQARIKRVRTQARIGMEEIYTADPSRISQSAQSTMAVRAMILSDIKRNTKPAKVRAQITHSTGNEWAEVLDKLSKRRGLKASDEST